MTRCSPRLAGFPHVASWQVEALSAQHVRIGFNCGVPLLDDFLIKLSSQYEKRNFARVFVAVSPPEVEALGYYSLSAGAVSLDVLPDENRRKLPRHPVPVAHLGRLAVASKCRGQRLGEFLLIDALRRCQSIADSLGLHAVEAVAIDDGARQFYLKYGFEPLIDDPRHLYLTMAKIRMLDR